MERRGNKEERIRNQRQLKEETGNEEQGQMTRWMRDESRMVECGSTGVERKRMGRATEEGKGMNEGIQGARREGDDTTETYQRGRGGG